MCDEPRRGHAHAASARRGDRDHQWAAACPRGCERAPRRRRRAREGGAEIAEEEPSREAAALEAAREAKYRDLREAELDYRTGKLSATDYEAIRDTLRGEALEILDQLEGAARGPAALDLEQRDRVGEEEHGEHDRSSG